MSTIDAAHGDFRPATYLVCLLLVTRLMIRLIGRIITIISRTWDFRCRSWTLARERTRDDTFVANITVILFSMEKSCWISIQTGDNGSSSWSLTL